MNINSINQIYQVYKTSHTTGVNKTEKTSSAKDAVNISNDAKDFQTAFSAAMKSEDVREDLVNDIKSKVDDENYVDTDALVDKIVKKTNE